jgi:ParB family chromosome partitioning protein
MSKDKEHVSMVPIDQIRILNPRVRNQKKFKTIVENIANLGLKKPITISERKRVKAGEPKYDLVCGQGRLEAFITLGQEEIPAIVRNVAKEDRLLMSLAENLARRNQVPLEEIRNIISLEERGYAAPDIAKKIDISEGYVTGILKLWKKGEERLVNAVEKNRIPLSVALTIANADDKELQRALTKAYEEEKLKGKALLRARQIVEQRRHQGKGLRGARGTKIGKRKTNAETLVRAYEQEAKKQKHFVKKARLCETRILFVTLALQQLLVDDNFVNLLRAESLNTLPKTLAEHIKREEIV